MDNSVRCRSVCGLLVLVLAAAGLAPASLAAEPAQAEGPRSGDAWVDRQLDDISRYGERYRDAFIDELVRYQATPRELAQEVLAARWTPGDLYYACAMAQAIGQPCRNVIAEWTRDHEGGWADVGKRLGIAPGSPAFLKLKRGFVASYEHWARPLELDAELRRAFPDRAKAKSAGSDRKDADKNSQ
ncbi:hypothetical protein IP90_02447 [Luteimonas cucumeris]|uniref:Uncharacterized protein n=1 Tax=Luteimonas cucumeris TaxID=985012 RepID=A0A562L2L3_9GAMM|nr:hypothetical protein [Luteimonas cucumeris]TWI01887.1 hypothetical protein IP90_02447 [Luteimonas cucumeris]